MPPTAPRDLLEAAERWAALSRWERSEVGRALRRRGWSYGEIRDLIDVPSATLSGWCRDIRLTDDQVAAIRDRGETRRGVPRNTQRKRRAEIERIRIDARAFAAAHLHDPLFVAGTVLYWGEGAKTKKMLAVTNADDAALRLFIRWTRRFHDASAVFVLSLHLHHGDDEIAARRWWAEALVLDDPQYTRTFIKPAGSGHRTNVLPYGICRVRMRRATDAWYRTVVWIAVVAEAMAGKSDG